MNQKPTERLAPLVRGFRRVRFLEGYGDDDQLLSRLNQVMRRVRLEPLPADFHRLLSGFRAHVALHADALLASPAPACDPGDRETP
jgi:hypothetical protein